MNNIAVEFCTNHRQIDDEGYRARILPALPSTFDLWQQLPEDFVEPASPESPAERSETDWDRLHDG
jgi:hypothetical protein